MKNITKNPNYHKLSASKPITKLKNHYNNKIEQNWIIKYNNNINLITSHYHCKKKKLQCLESASSVCHILKKTCSYSWRIKTETLQALTACTTTYLYIPVCSRDKGKQLFLDLSNSYEVGCWVINQTCHNFLRFGPYTPKKSPSVSF